VVSGDLGAAYMGLQVLEREKQVFQVNPNNQPVLDDYTYLIERQLKPEARNDVKELLEKLEIKPTSMIDISDGLSSEVMHICKQSKLGCNLYEDKIPVDPQLINVCEEFNVDITTIALNGGEDYELLFTIKMEDFEKIKHNPNFSIILYRLSFLEFDKDISAIAKFFSQKLALGESENLYLNNLNFISRDLNSASSCKAYDLRYLESKQIEKAEEIIQNQKNRYGNEPEFKFDIEAIYDATYLSYEKIEELINIKEFSYGR
jgi:hypothetical protein